MGIRRPLRGPAPVKSAQQRLWITMRVHRRFTASDIASSAAVKIGTAQAYIGKLLRVGYLRRTNPMPRSGPGVIGIYVLIRDSGPNTPRLRADGSAWDVNKRELFKVVSDGR